MPEERKRPISRHSPRQMGLVPANVELQAVATILRWSPATLVRRIQEAIPAPVEQDLYLLMVKDYSFGIWPETFAKMLRRFTGGRILQDADLLTRRIGENLVFNRINALAGQIETALNVRETLQQEKVSVSVETLASLVLAYGETTDEVVGMVIDSVGLIKSARRMRMSDSQAISMILADVAEQATESIADNGSRPNVASSDDIIELLSSSFSRSSQEGWREEEGDPALGIHIYGIRPGLE